MKTILSKNDDDYIAEINALVGNISKDKTNQLKNLLSQLRQNQTNLKRLSQTDPIVRHVFNKKNFYKTTAFYGHFTTEVIKEFDRFGAVYDKKRKCYKIQLSQLSPAIVNAIAIIQEQNLKLKTLINQIVEQDKRTKKDDFLQKTLAIATLTGITTSAILFIKNHLQKKKAVFTAKESQALNERIAHAVNAMGYDINDSSYKNTKTMREKFFEAMRLNKNNTELADIVKDHIHGNQKRIEFIVKQESRLLLTEYQDRLMKQEKRTKFKWVHRTPYHPHDRHQHIKWFQESNKGRVFDLNNLPINPETGQPDKPGQDYNCHCKMRIIINE